MLEVIRDLVREGMASIIVTHEIAFARECTDYCLFMNDGKGGREWPNQGSTNTRGNIKI